MPTGKVHLRIELALLLALGVGGGALWWAGAIPGAAVGEFMGGYIFSCLFLSPDLDLWESRATRRWWIGRILWYPYSRLFHHRRVSHHLLLGPLTRIGYLAGIVLLGTWGWGELTGQRVRFPTPAVGDLIPLLLGLYLPNQVHILADRVWSKVRTWRRR